jgi:hypothetical protein
MTANTPDNCYLDKGHSAHDLLGPGEACKACGYTVPYQFQDNDGHSEQTAPRELAEAVAPRLTWTDEQAAEALIAMLPDAFEVTVARSWFRPRESLGRPDERAGASEWVSRSDHAAACRAAGRAILDLRAALAEANKAVLGLAADCYEKGKALEVAQDALAEAQRERDEARTTGDEAIELWRWENRKSLDQRDAAQAEAAKLREALTRAQWQVNGTCVVCRQPIHADDCAVGLALAAPPSTAATPEGK